MIALLRYRVFYGTTTALEPPLAPLIPMLFPEVGCPEAVPSLLGLAGGPGLVRWLPSGFYCSASTTLLHISGTHYHATEPHGIPRTTLARVCGSLAAADLGEG